MKSISCESGSDAVSPPLDIKVIGRDTANGIDRLQADVRRRRGGVEGLIEDGGEPAVCGNGHIVRPTRSGSDKASRELHATDVGIELAECAPGEIVRIGSLAGGGLVILDVTVAAHQDQAAVLHRRPK